MTKIARHRQWLIAVAATTFAGCVGPPPRPVAGSLEIPSRNGTEAVRAPDAGSIMLREGRAARDAGQFDQATNAIEQGLRIDPVNPYLWIELAEIKRDEGDHRQAEQMARKALTLAAGDRDVERRASLLIGR